MQHRGAGYLPSTCKQKTNERFTQPQQEDATSAAVWTLEDFLPRLLHLTLLIYTSILTTSCSIFPFAF